MVHWITPTVAQQLLFNTVRVETLNARGRPLSVGTSFAVAHTFPSGRQESFLVTNKHVVKGAATGLLYFTRRNPDGSPKVGDPFFLRLDDFAPQWHGHPNRRVDVAVLPLSWILSLIERDKKAQAYLMEPSTTLMASAKEIEEADVFKRIVFIGYPDGIFDQRNYTPIIRQGTTATPLQFDFSGRPVFVIDASIFPGSSGSPVYAYDLSWKGDIADIRLLGVLAEVFTQDDKGRIVTKPAPVKPRGRVMFKQLIDLGIVFKSRVILETLEQFATKHGLA